MEMIGRKVLKILSCPACGASLGHLGKVLVCFNKECRGKFSVKEGIPLLLPPGFKDSGDYDFKKAQIDFFNSWSSRDRGKENEGKTSFDRFFSPVVGEKRINYSEEEMRRLVESLPKSSLILEIGCGAGEHTAFLARLREDIHLVAIDLSLKSVLETRERIRSDERVKSKVSLIVADAERLPFKDESLDGVLSVMLFHHMASAQKTLGEIKRVLRPKGICLIVDMVSDNPFVTLPREIFPRLPRFIKKQLAGDYLLEGGEMPAVSVHHSKEIKKDIMNAQLSVVEEREYDLFVFVLGAVGSFFPFSKHLFPETILKFLYSIDRRLVRIRPFRKFAGAIALWLSR